MRTSVSSSPPSRSLSSFSLSFSVSFPPRPATTHSLRSSPLFLFLSLSLSNHTLVQKFYIHCDKVLPTPGRVEEFTTFSMPYSKCLPYHHVRTYNNLFHGESSKAAKLVIHGRFTLSLHSMCTLTKKQRIKQI